jgi:hypothetical protein
MGLFALSNALAVSFKDSPGLNVPSDPDGSSTTILAISTRPSISGIDEVEVPPPQPQKTAEIINPQTAA